MRVRPGPLVALLLSACASAPAPRRIAPPPAELAVAVRCDGALDAIGAPLAVAGDGALLRCAREAYLDGAALAGVLGAADATEVEPLGGAHLLRIAYATTRADGAPALATARVMIPDRARADGLVVVAHALADGCAPSAQRLAADALVAPWAARGWATIAPDYAGLGSPGTQGYGDGEDTARSTLDAVRALRALLGEGTPEPYVIVGHSATSAGATSSPRWSPPWPSTPGTPVRSARSTPGTASTSARAWP